VNSHEPSNRLATSVKRAVISAASAFGIKPVDRRWAAALSHLEGSFERTGPELAIYVMGIVTVAGVASILGVMAVRQYWQRGWTDGTTFFSIYAVCMLGLLYLLISRVNLRYVFGGGTLSAYNTWGRLLWSEDLTGLEYVTFFTWRGNTSMTLMWPRRKRSLMLFDSMRDAVNISLEATKKLAEGQKAAEIKEVGGPLWICPNCHEENPGNFEECWKCLKFRPPRNPNS
jgi:hypothetical protein